MAVRGTTSPGGRRALLAALIALPGLLVLGTAAWLLWGAATWDGGRAEQVPCAEALAFGGARPPAGAHDGNCTVESGIDTAYQGTFRMPRAQALDWLTGLSPQGIAPTTTGCGHGADLCLVLGTAHAALPPGAQAHQVSAHVFYENATTARVQWSAFTT